MINKFWEPFVVGVLAKESSQPGKRTIFVNGNKDLQFSIRIISNPPHSFPNSQRDITCYGGDLEKHGFEDDQFDYDERVNSLIDFLDENLLVFQIERKVTPNDEYFVARNIELMPKKASFTEKTSFFPVPLFIEKKEKKNEDDLTWEQFNHNIQEGKYIGRNDFVSREPEDTPGFVFYKTLQGEWIIVGEFDNHHYAHGGFSFITSDSLIKYTAVRKEITNEIYTFKQVAFISVDLEYELINDLKGSSTPTLTGNTDDLEVEPVIELYADAKEKENELNDVEQMNHEEEFMEQLNVESRKLMLSYKQEDLYNFHTSIKTGGLVILAGMSGTGKSQLVNAYQRALNLDVDKFLMVSVSPTWTDDSDLIGYPDIVNNVFRPADSGVVNLLIEAFKNPSKTFLICFDEMNLAKVEHYFSQFLSVLEMEKGRRRLKLYNPDLQNKFYNGSYYTPDVLIGENVFFVGTVNLDESTHHFSDKVLDRSNLIQLNIEPFNQLLLTTDKPGEKIEGKTKHSYNLNEFINQDKKVSLLETELDYLWETHELLQDVSRDMGIGPRVVKHIDKYVKNLKDLKDCPIDRKNAIDMQFVQRILPKIRGSEEMLKELIGEYQVDSKETTDSSIIELMNKYNQISDFTRSKKIVLEKAKELLRNGYTV